MLINNNSGLSLGKLQQLLVDKTQTKYSREGIRLFRKKQTEKNNLTKLVKVDKQLDTAKPVPKKPVQKKQNNGKSFNYSIHHINELLKKNPNHFHSEYLNYQINGGEYRGVKGKRQTGRLKSDFEKLLVFIRDVTE